MNERGVQAERIAAVYLQAQGLKLLASNYQCRYGEIDLVMRDNQSLVFVEVRMRRSKEYGGAGLSITPTKQHKLIRTAEHYLQTHGQSACRFDAILMNAEDSASIEWVQNAFEAA